MTDKANIMTDEIIYREETYPLVGCAIDVLNTLGNGLLEKPYENALAVEFGLRGIPFKQQPRFDVVYKHVNVGDYIPDLIAFDKIIVETKCIDKITDVERGQLLNYLRITGFRLGLIFNFRHATFEWERNVL